MIEDVQYYDTQMFEFMIYVCIQFPEVSIGIMGVLHSVHHEHLIIQII